jgi:streptomycin 6-kinase
MTPSQRSGPTGPRVELHNGVAIPNRVTKIVGESLLPGLAPGWLSSLPAVIEDVCTRRQIELEPVVADTFTTLVVFGTSRELGPVVIKSSAASADFVAQARALQIGAGASLPRLYEVDLERSVMVMERIVPGTELRHVAMDDEESTRLAAEMLLHLWRPVRVVDGLKLQSEVLRPLFEWTPVTPAIDGPLVRQAQELAASLLNGSPSPSLLHGDLHHWNVLRRASGDWAMIDLAGIAGDPAFDVARWMHNPPEVTGRSDLSDLLSRRLRTWADVTGLDRSRLASWTFVGNVLNAINCVEFAPDVMRTCLAVARCIRTILPG